MIIEHAAPIFNEKGIAGTTVDDVLQAAKVARGCLYNHFENKDDLSFQTADFLLSKINDKIFAVMNKKKTAREKIFAYLDFSLDPLNTYITGGCPILNMAVESDDNNIVVKEKIKTALITSQKLFSSILKEGIHKGEFSATLHPENFTFKMFAAIQGATVICRVMGTSTAMDGLVENLKTELNTFSL